MKVLDNCINRLSRRRFLQMSAAAQVAVGTVGFNKVFAQSEPQRLLLRGGTVLTLDSTLGDFERADILIEGSKIVAVAPEIDAGDATLIAADNTIVMPGFVDTHRHCWWGQLRNLMASATLRDYLLMRSKIAPHYRPEDVYIANLVSTLGAINAGVTTVFDWSHISNTPAHSDAAIAALKTSRIRALYGFGPASGNSSNQAWPQDIKRLKREHFADKDSLISLAMSGLIGPSAAHDWGLAREVGARISLHVNGTGSLIPLHKQGLLGDDVTCVHCSQMNDEEWSIVAEEGCSVSISTPIEMQMGHGLPAIQKALDFGVRPSLSIDTETSVSGDMFGQMRAALALQRLGINERERRQEANTPPRLTAREVLEFATLEGARANGMADVLGTLTPGKQADLIMLRTDRINVAPINSAVGAVVTGMDSSNVDTVMIGGRIVKQGGKLVGIQLDDILAQANESREFLLKKSGYSTSVV